MTKISKHNLLLKYKDKDDFIYSQLLNILEYPFNEIFEYADGNIYIGETENKKRHGYGFYIYEDIKAIYQGQWKENSKNGYGILYNKNDVIYSGEWLNNISHGFGCSYKKKKIYFGCYKYGLMNGVGIVKKNKGLNLCLFKSNAKKVGIEISKNMEINICLYKDNEIYFKNKLSKYFPYYKDNNISQNIQTEVFYKILNIDKSAIDNEIEYNENCKKNKSTSLICEEDINNVTKNTDTNFNLKHFLGVQSKKFKYIKKDYCDVNKSNSFCTPYDNYCYSLPSQKKFNKKISNYSNPVYDNPLTNNNNNNSMNTSSIPKHIYRYSVPINSYINQSDNDMLPFEFDKIDKLDKIDDHIYKSNMSSQVRMTYEKNKRVKKKKKKKNSHLKRVKAKILNNENYLFHELDSNSSNYFSENMTRNISNYSDSEKLKKKKKIIVKLIIKKKENMACLLDSPNLNNDKTSIPQKKNRNKIKYTLFVNKHIMKYFCRDNKQILNDKVSELNYYNGLKTASMQSSDKLEGDYFMSHGSGTNEGIAKQIMPKLEKIKRKKEKELSKYIYLLNYLKEINKKNKIECIYQWRIEHISILLYLFELDEYIPSFISNNVEGFHFFIMSRKILNELGVYKNEHIYFFMNFINTFNNIHNIYLQIFLKWEQLNKSLFSLKYNLIRNKDLTILKKLKKSKNLYLGYYGNCFVCLRTIKSVNFMSNLKIKKEEKNIDEINDSDIVRSYTKGHDKVVCSHEKIEIEKKDDIDKTQNNNNLHNLNIQEKGKQNSFIGTNLFNSAQNLLFDDRPKENIFRAFESIKNNILSYKNSNINISENNTKFELFDDGGKGIEKEKNINQLNEYKNDFLENGRDNNNTCEYLKMIWDYKNMDRYMKKISRRICFIKEHFIMSNVRHPNIVEYIGNIITWKKNKKNKKIREHFGLVFEYIKGKRLYDILYNKKKKRNNKENEKKYVHKNDSKDNIYNGYKKWKLNNKVILKVLYEICLTLHYLHEKNIYHGNINSKNLYITKNGNVKICNFKNAHIQNYYDYKANIQNRPERSEKKNTIYYNLKANNFIPLPYITYINYTKQNIKYIDEITSAPFFLYTNTFNLKLINNLKSIYTAPEVLRGEEYTNKSDIYSLGIIMYELIFETLPFKNKHNNNFNLFLSILISTCYFQNYIYFDMNKFKNNNIMSHIFINITILIKLCLNPDPSNRPTSKYLYNYFKNILDILKIMKKNNQEIL
ncbi:protein kinase, putative [Plasmodium vinckei vinckei]|uniref:Protein kinase, putative n=1 Tax=Plasmodium vinckei vinckei TaxID=54757 RepID=A0A449BRP0_PLAVN|nr:protein kinase, putative [Plasmodium vinckei vinckei]VEV56082.1 protein kinase, putative [Plasmodium vinckei vinckei]